MSAETHDDRIERTILGIQADQTDTNSNKREKKPLHFGAGHGTINAKDGWVLCQECGKMKLLRLPPGGKVRAYIYCRHCHREQFLNID